MQTVNVLIREQALIVHDERRDTWAVKVGNTMPHFGGLFSCEQWCRDRNIPVRNQDEVNRVKYGNMPVQEMMQ